MIWPSLAHGKFQVVCSPLPLKKRDRNPAEKDISDVALWFFRRRWFLQFDLWYFRTFVWLSPTGTSPWVNVQCWNRQGPSFFSFRLSWEAFLSWSLEPLWVRLCGTLIDLFGGHPKDWQRSNAVQGHFCETKKHAERILQFMSLWVYDSWDFCNSLSLFDTHTHKIMCVHLPFKATYLCDDSTSVGSAQHEGFSPSFSRSHSAFVWPLKCWTLSGFRHVETSDLEPSQRKLCTGASGW